MHGGWPAGLDDEIAKHVAKLEKTMGRKLGDPTDPLLVSVRSGAKFSMPGMMDTVLNLGLNDKSVKGLAKVTGDERFAYDCYRRFIAMYGRIVLDVDGELFEHPLEDGQGDAPASRTTPSSRPPTLKELCEHYKAVVKAADRQAVPAGPDQAAARRGRGGVQSAGTAPGPSPTGSASASATTSAPRSTCRRWCSATATTTRGTGVGFTRNAATGENKPYGDFLINAQGEDVVAGIRNTEDLDALARHFPKIHDELLDIFDRLERHYQDMCDTEFTIEQGKLWMLQTRVGKRTGAAALRMAVDMTKGTGKGKATLEDHQARRRCMRVTADHLDSGAAPAVRRQAARSSPRASPRRRAPRSARCTSPPTTPRRRRRARREGHPRPQRDEPGGRPRHDGRRGHPHRPRRPRQPRRRRRPRLGHAGRRRRRVGARSPASRSPSATSRSTRATSSRSTARPARSCSAR